MEAVDDVSIHLIIGSVLEPRLLDLFHSIHLTRHHTPSPTESLRITTFWLSPSTFQTSSPFSTPEPPQQKTKCERNGRELHLRKGELYSEFSATCSGEMKQLEDFPLFAFFVRKSRRRLFCFWFLLFCSLISLSIYSAQLYVVSVKYYNPPPSRFTNNCKHPVAPAINYGMTSDLLLWLPL